MAHTIEIAKTGRAKCRKCKQAIAKDTLRFGEEVPNAFSESGDLTYLWYHLACAAKTKPTFLEEALRSYPGEVADRAELEQLMTASAGKQKPSTFPYAEKAPSARSRCLACEMTLEKGEVRIAIEREVDTGAFVTKGAGYLHPGCAAEFVDDDELAAKVKANTLGLAAAELESVLAQMQRVG